LVYYEFFPNIQTTFSRLLIEFFLYLYHLKMSHSPAAIARHNPHALVLMQFQPPPMVNLARMLLEPHPALPEAH
jgi:hypothetical protein